MDFKGVEIVCPYCKGDLNEQKKGDDRFFVCQSCHESFPVVLGIPDLRVFDDPYNTKEKDRNRGRALDKEYGKMTFAESLDLYYRLATVVPPEQARMFKRAEMAGEARAEAALARWEKESSGDTGNLRLLDVGCGSAALLGVAAGKYKQVVGIDIAFRWMVMAKKRLAEKGLQDIPLICACAEALPFPDESFDRVVAQSVIEHLRDQEAGVKESYRVLRPGGDFFLGTANRLRFGPDPHIGLWCSGYLPQKWVTSYLERKNIMAPKIHLLSKNDLARLVTENGFKIGKMYLPDISGNQRQQFGFMLNRMIDAYHLVKRLPIGRQVLDGIGPLIHAVAKKPETAAA